MEKNKKEAFVVHSSVPGMDVAKTKEDMADIYTSSKVLANLSVRAITISTQSCIQADSCLHCDHTVDLGTSINTTRRLGALLCRQRPEFSS